MRRDGRASRLLRSRVEKHYGAVVAYYVRRIGDRERAESLAQSVFELAWKRVGQMPDEPGVRSWLLQMAYFYLSTSGLGPQRKFGCEHRSRRSACDLRGSSHNEVFDTEMVAFSELRPLEQEALCLVHWDGLSPSEAAIVLGCSSEILAARLYRARTALATAYLNFSAIVPDGVECERHTSTLPITSLKMPEKIIEHS